MNIKENAVTIKIEKCKCGGFASLCKYTDTTTQRNMYWIQCSKCCGTRTPMALHAEEVIELWNKLNRPKKNKPKYVCWNCEKDVSLGFAVCPHCGAELDWG